MHAVRVNGGADACSYVPPDTLVGSDLERNTLTSEQIAQLGLGEIGDVFPVATASRTIVTDPAGVDVFWLGRPDGRSTTTNPSSSSQSVSMDYRRGALYDFGNCTVATFDPSIIVPCFKAPKAGTYNFDVQTTFSGSQLGSRGLFLLVWNPNGGGVQQGGVYSADGSPNFLTGTPASELPLSETGTQQLDLTAAVDLKAGQKFTIYMFAQGSEAVSTDTKLLVRLL